MFYIVPKILNFIIDNLTINCPKVLYKILSHSGITFTDIFGRIYLSSFLYISNVKVEWPPANSKCGCKITLLISIGKTPVSNFATKRQKKTDLLFCMRLLLSNVVCLPPAHRMKCIVSLQKL